MSAPDPYATLGVSRQASPEEIQKAYRRLAKKLHPDLNPGNREAETQFKDLSAAYEFLGDPEKRARFDRGEIDASGAKRPRSRFYRDFAYANGPENRYTTNAGFSDFVHEDEILSELFGRRRGARVNARGRDQLYRMEISFIDAVKGGTKPPTLPDGSSLDLAIPPGMEDGQLLRLRGKGLPGISSGPPGDALVEIQARPHPYFRREGDDIHLDLPVSLAEAVQGARIKMPTPDGPVSMVVPKGANTGTVLRLKGRGVPRLNGERGNEYLTLKVLLPDPPDPELQKFVSAWAAGKAHNPRQFMEI